MMMQSKTQKQVNRLQSDLKEYFPRTPYQIQLDIAIMLHQALQSGRCKLAIIQSPTGTGKTYSLLVPLIAWLKKNRSKVDEGGLSEKKAVIPSWLKKPSQQRSQKMLSQKKRKVDNTIDISEVPRQLKKSQMRHMDKPMSEQEEIQVESDGEQRHSFKRKVHAMVERQLKVEDKGELPKIIFVSRTHSQIAQVMQSIRQIMREDGQMKYLQLGSKDHSCINKTINTNKINIAERCQYILDHSRCQFFHSLSVRSFYNLSIEEANKLGSQHSLCPYYATRSLIDSSDIICVPYVTILNPEIRTRIGINIHNSIIVFDEGHNIIASQRQIHSPEVYAQNAAIVSQQVDEYLKKYGEKLKISNKKILMHFLQILRALVAAIQKIKKDNISSQYANVPYLKFIGQMEVKELKIYKIVKYIQLNNLDQKLAYFQPIESTGGRNQMKKGQEQQKKISPAKINCLLQFLLQFSQFNLETQILLVKWEENRSSIKILCLESNELENIVKKSRLAIFAGGTMEPLDDFRPLLQIFKEKSILKKYPHIIKKQQCKVTIIKKFCNQEIIFNYQAFQKNIEILKLICLKSVGKIITKTEKGGGIVIFIQNYKLLTFFKDAFKSQAYFQKMLFDGKQGKDHDVFERYKKLIQSDKENNYILVSVMGGKLSEGINFSDRLARSLVVLGLPYANLNAPQIIETIAYLQQNKKSTKKEYLQSLCLRTLNQTIGRGVRHINDHVNIYLIDARFESIRHKLSEWMRDRVSIVNDLQLL